MLKEERQQKIIKILNIEQKVIAKDLSQRLSVSEDTIRRDLKELDKQGLIKRVHSGALKVGPPVIDFEKREQLFTELKNELSRKAISYVKDGMVILIDGGTTNLSFVHLFPLSLKATVITNSPPIAVALAHHSDIEVIMLGGTLYKQSMVNLGIDTVDSLNTMRADLYIMGIYNIDPEIGISVPTLSEALVKRKMASVSTEILGLVTADKLGTVSNQIVMPTNNLTYLVTEKVNKEIAKKYSKQKIKIIE